jgi:hypothetical protein
MRVVRPRPRPPYSRRKSPSIHWIEGWVSHTRHGENENPCPRCESNPALPVPTPITPPTELPQLPVQSLKLILLQRLQDRACQ